ncbi:MAG: CPBP family intramembrane glutamic endopeptidase [Opitutaceae bacterium]
MTEELDAAAIIASLIILTILGGSTLLWIFHIQRPRNEIMPNAGAQAWQINWVDFGIFICAQVVFVTFVQLVGFSFLKDSSGNLEGGLTPWLAVIAVLLLQIPMLVVFFAARRGLVGLKTDDINTQDYSFGAALKEAAPNFVMFLPVIWIVSFIWSGFLSILQRLELIEAFAPQELITLFTEGGDPLAIGLLVIFAVALAPIVEEIIFRGCLYRFFKSKTSLIPAQIISGVVFAIMHWNLMSFVPLVLVGVLLARVYEKSGNLLVAICFHAFFNGFSLLMLLIMTKSEMIPQ